MAAVRLSGPAQPGKIKDQKSIKSTIYNTLLMSFWNAETEEQLIALRSTILLSTLLYFCSNCVSGWGEDYIRNGDSM